MRQLVLIAVLFSVVAHAGDYFHTTGAGGVERYYEATPTGLRAYVSDLRAMEPASARLVEPALHWIEEKEMRATMGASIQGFAGLGFLFSSFTFLRDERTKAMNVPAATLGVGMLVAALIVYDVLSPSRADILDFINSHNESLPVRPLHYRLDPSVPFVSTPKAAGVTIPF